MPKTKDAFALRDFDADKLFDFKGWYAREYSDDALLEGRRLAIESLEKLSIRHRRIFIHLSSLERYQVLVARKIARSEGDIPKLKSRILKAEKLLNRYKEITLIFVNTISAVKDLIDDTNKLIQRNILKTFAANLKKARKATGMTQTQAAAKIGRTQNVYTSYETARREPSFDTLIELSKLFNKSTDWLLGLPSVG